MHAPDVLFQICHRMNFRILNHSWAYKKLEYFGTNTNAQMINLFTRYILVILNTALAM